jgi:hypothetical protein
VHCFKLDFIPVATERCFLLRRDLSELSVERLYRLPWVRSAQRVVVSPQKGMQWRPSLSWTLATLQLTE